MTNLRNDRRKAPPEAHIRPLNNVSRYRYVDNVGTDRLHVARRCIFLRNNAPIKAYDGVLISLRSCDVARHHGSLFPLVTVRTAFQANDTHLLIKADCKCADCVKMYGKIIKKTINLCVKTCNIFEIINLERHT